MDELLRQGITAAQAGRREEARALLTQVVEADERNEQAWLWLAGVVETPADMRTCLENVLDLNPANVKAQQGLAWVNKRYGPPAAAPPEPDDPIVPAVPATPPEPVALDAATSAPSPPPDDRPPAPGKPYTGPTTRLDKQPAAQVAQPPAPSPEPAASEAPAASEHPCPYCGTPTAVEQQRCPQCHNSLMIRAAPRDKRSVPLTILGVLWGIGAGFSILAAILSLLGALLVFQVMQQSARQPGPRASASFPIELLIPVVVLLIAGGLSFAVMRGLLRRERWAYFVAAGFAALGVIGALCNVAQGAVALRVLPQSLKSAGLPPGTINALGALIGVAVLASLGVQLLGILLVWLSYRDFFGPMVRFLPEIGPGDHMEHYNNGVAYKNRGMWYMAAREWEAAVRKAPRDLNYLHALGLAYAQIKRFDRARAALDTALRIAPEHAQIKESRDLIEQMAGRKT